MHIPLAASPEDIPHACFLEPHSVALFPKPAEENPLFRARMVGTFGESIRST